MRRQTIIRKLEDSDLDAFISLCTALDEETSFLLYESQERPQDLDRYRSMISSGALLVVVAEDADTHELLGYAQGGIPLIKRRKHTMRFSVAILKKAWARGLGRILIEELFRCAKEKSITRVEATILANNRASLKLAALVGLQQEGVFRSSMNIDSNFLDEIAFGKAL